MLLKDIKCPNCDAYHDPTLKQCPDCHKDNELFGINRLPKRVLFLSPVAQLGLFLTGFAYAGMLILQLVVALFAGLFAGESGQSNNVAIISVVYILMFIGLALITLSARRKQVFDCYKSGIDYIYGVAYAVTIIFVETLLGTIISLFHNTADNANQLVAIEMANNYPILAVFILVLIGPICEELTYRVGLFSFLRRINKYLAFVITVLVFAFIHFSFDSNNIANELWALPSYLACGFVLTLAYEHRGPACSMTAHICYNLVAFILMLVEANG